MNTPAPLDPAFVNSAVNELWSYAPHECHAISTTHAMSRCVVDQSTLRPGGYISGPTQFSLADVTLWYLAFGVLGRVEPMALTSELSIRFLRPAQGSTMWARADLERAGRTSLVGTVRIWMDEDRDRPVSTAQGTYALPN